MKRALSLIAAALLAAPLFAAESARYLVALRHPVPTAPLGLLRDSEDARRHAVRAFRSVDAFAADLTAGEVAALRRSAEVRYVSAPVERHAFDDDTLHEEPSGSIYNSRQVVSYGIGMVHASELWPLTRGGGPVNVAIFDTGVDALHPDLAANIAGGYNTFTGTNDTTDDNGHGTHVSGIVAALDNGIGVVGVAPEARLWEIKVLDKFGFGTDENIIAAVDWVIARKHEIGGRWIMSLSLGASLPSPVEQEAVQRALDEGILIAAAAGNGSFPDVQYPAGYSGVIAVGAVDSTGTIAGFSNRGPHLSLVAPGVQILSTTIRGSVPAAGITLGQLSITAASIEGSSRGEVAGPYVVCGLGRPEDFPADTRGRIAVIQRGELTFNQKVRNAQDAGAIAVVIYNRDDSDIHVWTLLRPDCDNIAGCDDTTHDWPVVLAVSAQDGQRLVGSPLRVVDMGSWLDDYRTLSGTSMATPHVSGVLALLWSLAPNATSESIRHAVLTTAIDLGEPGFDLTYGYGLIDAFHAAVELAPERFGRSEPPRNPPGSGRPPAP